MTLDEAIKHEEEVAEEKERDRDVRKIHLDNRNTHNNIVHYEKACKCAEEHRQLADWLKDYKRLLEQQPCDDCVSRQAVDEMIKAEMPERGMWEIEGDKEKETVCEVCIDLMQKLSALSPVTPQPKIGRWINQHVIYANATIDFKVCSKCRYEFSYDAETGVSDANYCPNCGAKMVDSQESEE